MSLDIDIDELVVCPYTSATLILGRPQSTFLALLPMVHSEDVGLTPRKRGIRPSASAV